MITKEPTINRNPKKNEQITPLMKPIKEIKLNIFADYFQFYIQDDNPMLALVEEWTQDAVDRLLAVASGIVGVGTARNMFVPVSIKFFDSEPFLLADSVFDKINECDLEITKNNIVILGCTDSYCEAERIIVDNGIYRLRIYYANLDKLSEDGLDGDDFYEIHAWKVDEEKGITIIK